MTGLYPAPGAYAPYPAIKVFYADAGYCRETFEKEVMDMMILPLDITARHEQKKWEILPKRWIIERTFAWMNNSRRLSKDYEICIDSGEAMVRISHIHTLLKRL